MEDSAEFELGPIDEIKYKFNRLVMGRGYLRIDYLHDKLSNQLVDGENKGKPKDQNIIDHYAIVSKKRNELNRPNQGPL